jgi:hypothetical protein
MTDVEWEDEDADDDWYLKYAFEGVASLSALSAALRAVADDFDAREAEGWTLAEPVDGGWAHLVPPD